MLQSTNDSAEGSLSVDLSAQKGRFGGASQRVGSGASSGTPAINVPTSINLHLTGDICERRKMIATAVANLVRASMALWPNPNMLPLVPNAQYQRSSPRQYSDLRQLTRQGRFGSVLAADVGTIAKSPNRFDQLLKGLKWNNSHD